MHVSRTESRILRVMPKNGLALSVTGAIIGIITITFTYYF